MTQDPDQALVIDADVAAAEVARLDFVAACCGF